MTDTPESPPAQPIIPIGFGTKLGLATSAIAGIVALVAAVLDGDHSTETLVALVLAVVAAVRTVDGRMNQATAALGASGGQIGTPESPPRNHDEDISLPNDHLGDPEALKHEGRDIHDVL
jgi:hypothetical protein